MDEVETQPVTGLVHIDTLISGMPELWSFYTMGIRRIYFLCRTKGNNPNSAKGVIDYLTSVMGKETSIGKKPEFPDVSWVWDRPDKQYMLVVSSRGVEFRVPTGTTPQAAIDIWRAFHLYFQDEKPVKAMKSPRLAKGSR